MTGAMLSLPPVSLGLLGAIVVLASVAGVVDVLHWKTWTWPRAHRSRTATLAGNDSPARYSRPPSAGFPTCEGVA